MAKLILYKPIYPFVVTQYFGKEKTDPRYLATYQKMGLQGHNGWDCVRPYPYETESCAVRASHDGEVMYAGMDACFGYGVVLKTLEQFDYEEKQCYFKSIYWHVEPKIPVKVGQKVKTGDVIAFASHTGCNIKPHLHWGLKPIYQGESKWTWYTLVPDNGYMGAIDIEPYVSKMTAYEFINVSSELIPKITPIIKPSIKEQKISIIQKLIILYKTLIGLLMEDRTFGAIRSSGWRDIQQESVNEHPYCEFHGGKGKVLNPLNVHHIKPFHLFPELELVKSNLIVACRFCHLWYCHLGSWKSYNIYAREDADSLLKRIKERP